MTQQLLRRREVDGRAVERVKARYEADGFDVSFGEAPSPRLTTTSSPMPSLAAATGPS